MNRESEIKLAEALARGDEAAFDEVYKRYGRRIYGFIYRMTGNPGIAEDITHEAFMVLIEHPQRYSAERGSLITFLCAISRNAVMNHLRRSHSLDESFDDPENFDLLDSGASFDPLAGLIAKELADRIEACITALPPFQREVLILREYEELSYQQIASITDTESGTVKARLYRARQNLAAALATYVRSTTEDKCYELQ